MKSIRRYLLGGLVTGFIIIVPLYLSILLLLKAMSSVRGLVKPVALLLPDWLPGEDSIAFLLLLILCLMVGMIVRTKAGRALRERIERSLFERIPGYALLRSLTQRLVGEDRENVWKPALVEIEEALVPAFIIEEFDDRRYTVFVPSVPTPFAGAVYVLERGRVHPVDVPFTQAIKVISRWGQGSKELVAAMERNMH
ncbi:MAG: DUF502 domain-containing protein [Thermodesulfobacteriota bacterium]